jgi:acyl carrier protein
LERLKSELKELIVNECAKDVDAASIQNDAVLFEDEALELDSMDALQISMALQREYGIDITDSKVLRKVMVDIDTMAKFVEDNRKK